MNGLGYRIVIVGLIFITWFAVYHYLIVTEEQRKVMRIICAVLMAASVTIMYVRKKQIKK